MGKYFDPNIIYLVLFKSLAFDLTTFISKNWKKYIVLPERTSDSLNEGLPIKMTREKFQTKRYFFYKKDSRFNHRLIHKSSFLIGQVQIEKYGLKTLFLLFNI